EIWNKSVLNENPIKEIIPKPINIAPFVFLFKSFISIVLKSKCTNYLNKLMIRVMSNKKASILEAFLFYFSACGLFLNSIGFLFFLVLRLRTSTKTENAIAK